MENLMSDKACDEEKGEDGEGDRRNPGDERAREDNLSPREAATHRTYPPSWEKALLPKDEQKHGGPVQFGEPGDAEHRREVERESIADESEHHGCPGFFFRNSATRFPWRAT